MGPVTQKVDRTKTGPGVQLWQPKVGLRLGLGLGLAARAYRRLYCITSCATG